MCRMLINVIADYWCDYDKNQRNMNVKHERRMGSTTEQNVIRKMTPTGKFKFSSEFKSFCYDFVKFHQSIVFRRP